MLKRKLLMAILPLATAAIVVGAGFSAWEFVTGNSSTSASLGVTVDGLVDKNYTVSFDQTNLRVLLDQGGFNNTNLDDGITIQYNNGDAWTTLNTLKANIVNNSTTGTPITASFNAWRFTIQVTDNNYFEVKNLSTGDFAAGFDETVSTSENTITISGVYGGTTEFSLDLLDAEGWSNFIQYKSGAKPTSVAEYKQMLTTFSEAAVSGNKFVTIGYELYNSN